MLYASKNILLKLSEEAAVRLKITYACSMRVYCHTREENTKLNTGTKEED